ncbi:MAG: glycoside hydrolase family 2 TIM barrel-domain containing protein [bacterium]
MKIATTLLLRGNALLALLAFAPAVAQPTQRQLLSGTGSDSTVPWDFRVSGGRQAGQWMTIPVPSNWEMQGFGTYHYSNDWSPPAPDSIGEYRHSFAVPAGWAGKRIDIVFGASMTDTDVRINGQAAGPIHQGGFTEFRYDVGKLIRPGQQNLLEVRVKKFSSDSSINRAERRSDFWLFGGIFRPVWLEARPTQNIIRTALDARHTGELTASLFLDGITSADRVTGQVVRLDGAPVGPLFSAAIASGADKARLHTRTPGVRAWTPETPNRYRVHVRLMSRGTVVHEATETFGFRTIEVRPHDGVYVNGTPVRIRGVNRHSFWPTTGRTTNHALSVSDALLIKEMNMNAVRMSHYPPDPHFLDVADSLGLFVLDELTGWQAFVSTAAGKPLVRELVIRDVNHPSIIFWDNGNEGGFNTALDADYALWDPQARTVLHPWQNFGGINTAHYEAYGCCAGSSFGGDDLMMPTEFLHALYDGGGGAGLDDWWKLMVAHPLGVGGFIWAFADEGIVRADQNGRIDVTGNRAPDGLVGPYREKEGSFFTVKKVWSPVYIAWGDLNRLPSTFTGTFRVENRYDFTDLRQVRFAWRLMDFPSVSTSALGHTVASSGTIASPTVPPRGVGTLQLSLPRDWSTHDALALTATDQYGREIYTWTWMTKGAATIAATAAMTAAPAASPATGEKANGVITMRANGTEVRIDSMGRLQRVTSNGQLVSLRDGPRLVSGPATLTSLSERADGNDFVVEAKFTGELQRVEWRLQSNGWLSLNYAYRAGSQPRDYLGVTFDYPDSLVTGMRWLGRGPFRVWKNRTGGVEFDVWHKSYNDVMTGTEWKYPEFKGFHENVYWATLETREVPITIVTATNDVFLRVLTPHEPTAPGSEPGGTHMVYPPGDLSFLNGISPIGTKFAGPLTMGPSGQPNIAMRNSGASYAATIWFKFGQ